MESNLFDGAPVISRYTRARAISDGVLVDLMQRPTPERPDLDDLAELVRQAGFTVPVAMTAAAFAEAVAPIDGEISPCQDLKGRLWDVLFVLAWEIRSARRSGRDETDTVRFEVRVWRQKGYEGATRTGHRVVRLKSVIGPDDDRRPCITLMLPDES